MEAHEQGFFTEATSAEVVTGRNSTAGNARLKAVMEVVIRKLHEAVKEIEPTEDEWFEAIQFLTRTGQICNEWRQEFILLSDVLGVSMLVDAINNRKPSGASESTVLGPFHVADAPELPMGANICLDRKGEDMLIHGRILDTEGRPIAGAVLDVWQANDEGFYDVQQKGIAARLQPARRVPHRRRRQLLVPRRQAALLSDPRRRPGRQAACTRSAVTPTARRICISSLTPTASRRSPPTSSIPTIPISTPTRCSA